MFPMTETPSTAERLTARKEVRMRPSDEQRIRQAAAAVGLTEADFIRQAALEHVVSIERRALMSVLPEKAFAAFKSAVSAPGKPVPGLTQAAMQSEGLLKDA